MIYNQEYKYKVFVNKIELDFVEDIVRDFEYKYFDENKILTLVGGECIGKGIYNLT